MVSWAEQMGRAEEDEMSEDSTAGQGTIGKLGGQQGVCRKG
jgi:hypothetical protein